MATKHYLLFISVLLLSTTLALSSQKEDLELQQCKQQCQQQPHYDLGMKRQCERRCEERHEQRGEGERDAHRRDPEQKLQQCRQQCEERHPGEQQQRRQCEQSCEEKYREESQHHQRQDTDKELRKCQKDCQKHGRPRLSECERQCEEEYGQRRERRGPGNAIIESEEGEGEEEEGSSGSPYFFSQKRFKHWIKSQHGSEKLLERFHERSDLLLGIANYRLSILEADPNTFVMPKHRDADTVFYVINGRGAITLVSENNRETHDLRQGDIIKVAAGTIAYLINKDSNQKLYIAKLLQPISTPGRFEDFFGAGGQDPESFYRSFSNEVLQAALNAPREKIERLFGKQRKGVIVRASEEQIRAMSRGSSKGGRWPWGEGESQKKFNLLNKRPEHSNERGQLYEADARDYQELRDLDVKVTFANITGGSMMLPFYNTRVTKVSLVVEGSGWVEMVCPHLSRQSQRREGQQEGGQQGKEEEEQQEQGQQRGERYQRVKANLSPGTVFVAPPGHPTVLISSGSKNLQIVCFEIRAERNQRVFLAGERNALMKLDKEAKELSFDASAREVDEIFNAQKGEVFVEGPKERGRQEEGGRGRPLASILDFAGF